jgi:hypothetical protein
MWNGSYGAFLSNAALRIDFRLARLRRGVKRVEFDFSNFRGASCQPLEEMPAYTRAGPLRSPLVTT